MSSERKTIVLKDITYVPGGRDNLSSITKMMNSGWKLFGYMEEGMTLIKRKHSIRLEKGPYHKRIVICGKVS